MQRRHSLCILTACLTMLTSGIANRSPAQEKDLAAELAGDWIRYEHDQIVIAKIADNKHNLTIYSQYGVLWQQFAGDLQLSRKDGNKIYTVSNAERLHPPGGGSVPSQFIANYIVHDDRFFFMRGIFDKTIDQPQVREFRRTTAPDDQLLIAARSGDLETVAKLLDAGVKVDATVPHSYTALAYAAAGGHLQIMKMLLKNGAKVEAKARFNKTPLLHAAGSDQVAACKLLVKEGANVKAVNWGGRNCVFETCFWGQPETLTYFLSIGCDPNTTTKGTTPLHHAVARLRHNGNQRMYDRYVDCVRILLKHGADKSKKNNAGKTAGEVAAQRRHTSVAELLR
ncbi:MAG: ankyrin repeat domain-containing protein [Planctomycetota bacterium]|nr:ankyrin repeat domain-containing protein [Planctomycetota bacterium]